MSEEQAPGLYLHLPFCSSICPYCDFYVLKGGVADRQSFVDRLLREIELRSAGLWPEFVAQPPAAGFDTIYLGGGTPSHLAVEELARLLEGCRDLLRASESASITLEANPEDVSERTLEEWRALGVTTLSIGVQSFSDSNLRFLGRRHDARTALSAVELAQTAGFDSVSLDLIFSLPDQGADALQRDLEIAVNLAIGHISLYQLTIHQGTPFGFQLARGRLRELPDDRQAELFLLAHRLIADAGYDAYEVSNFALTPSHRSRHNQKYWRHVPYLGIGPSAHSHAGRYRWWNERKIKPWSARLDEGLSPMAGSETLATWQLVLERLMLGFRTREGVDLAAMPEGWGSRLTAENADLIDELSGAGLLDVEPGRLKPTKRGLALADSLPLRFELPRD